MTRYAASRQKSCHQCSNAKTRCDRKTPRCTRCSDRGQSCSYSQDSRTTDATSVPRQASSTEQISEHSSPATTFTPARSTESAPSTTNVQTPPSPPLDFTGLNLICPINADEISSRWLNPYITASGQIIKTYPPSVTAFLARVLKSYASIVIHGRELPPFIHTTQLHAADDSAKSPLSICFNLVKTCEQQLSGSEMTTVNVMQQEMSRLVELRFSVIDHMTRLAAFQAYLIYSMVLFFRSSQTGSIASMRPSLRDAMMNLQQFACSCAKRGIVCAAERAEQQQQTRPRWEEWIVAEATRRTIYVVYLFDSLLSSQEGLPTFLGTELRGLPAPGSGALWRARGRAEWEMGYDAALAEWAGEGPLRIDELWPVPAEFDEAQKAARSERIDRWLRDVDEYGMMMYATTSTTHGT